MFRSRKVNRKIQIIYKNHLYELPTIQPLAIDLFNVEKVIANPILRSIDYNLRSQIDFSVSCVNTSHFGLNSLPYVVSKVWNMVPLELK